VDHCQLSFSERFSFNWGRSQIAIKLSHQRSRGDILKAVRSIALKFYSPGRIQTKKTGFFAIFAVSQPNNTTPAPANLSLQPSTAATNPGSLTVNSANTIPDDILLNGGAIPTMMTFSETDDDILIYDTNSLLGSLTSAQTQPIIPLTGTSISGSIAPNTIISANDDSLLLSPAASPSNPLANSDLTGISSL